MNPSVSICIPTYNEITLLRKTLDSIQIQTYNNYEIIITDDTEDDSVKQLLNEYNFHGKLTYIKNNKKKGSPENWNEAIRHARGDYIKILHHDDWFAIEDSLLEFVNMLESNTDTNFGFCSTINVFDNNEMVNFIQTRKQIKRLRRNPKCLINFKAVIGSPSTTIFRRDLNIYFDQKMKWLVDIDFYIRFLIKYKQFGFNPKPLVCISTTSKNRVTEKCQYDKEINLFEFFHLFKKVENRNFSDYKYFKYILIKILLNYKVATEDEIIRLGVQPPLSLMIKQAICLSNFILKFRPILSYMNRKIKK